MAPRLQRLQDLSKSARNAAAKVLIGCVCVCGHVRAEELTELVGAWTDAELRPLWVGPRLKLGGEGSMVEWQGLQGALLCHLSRHSARTQVATFHVCLWPFFRGRRAPPTLGLRASADDACLS